jgi:hypothetical protein
MNHYKSQFRDELAIIPAVARVLAVIAFVLVQIALLVLCPIYINAKDMPPHPAMVLISICGGLFLAIIILMVGYVNADSKRRGMNSLLWTLLVIFIPKALGFLAYFLLRKPLLMPCPKCGNAVGSDFRYCPKCSNAVTPTCAHCGRPINPDYVCCPYCGKPVGATATV